MELKEAIRILNWSQQQMRLGNLPDYSQNVYQAEVTVLQELEELQKENKELKAKYKTANEIIDEMNLDDEVKRISKESLDYYRNNIYECSVDILRVLYGELLQENEELKAKQAIQEFKIDWCEKNTVSKDKIKEKIEDIAYKIRLADGDLEILEKHDINHWYNHFAYVQESVAVANLRKRIDDIQELLKGE